MTRISYLEIFNDMKKSKAKAPLNKDALKYHSNVQEQCFVLSLRLSTFGPPHCDSHGGK